MRGVNKMVIEIKNPESEHFERAILFLKPESVNCPQNEISVSADRLLEAVVKRRKKAVMLPLAAVITIALAAALFTAAAVIFFI